MKNVVVGNMAMIALFSFIMCAASPTPLAPGSKAPPFILKDVNGKDHSLDGYFDSKYVVLMFIATQCPVSNAYNERMAKLFDDYSSRDVTFLGINSNKQESISEIKDHSAAHGFKFTVLKDVDNVVADTYGAQVTPEIYVVDANGVLRYHGRIDDSKDEAEVESRDLRATLDALLDGKEPPRTETKAFGCTIKRVKKQS